jgi:cell wall-associated NlpC family hydrolase
MNYARLTSWALTILVVVSGISCVPPQRYGGADSVTGFSAGDKTLRQKIIITARRQIGVPYKMGGVTSRGFDCSGFTMFVYKKNGLRLPRTAAQQYRYGRNIALRSAQPGDLLFFDTNGAKVSHVAIYLGHGSFIHAPSKGSTVRIDSVKNPYWKTHYCSCARYIR